VIALDTTSALAQVPAGQKGLVAQRKQMHESCGMMNKAPAAAIGATDPDHGAHHPQK
jgi:hypothetical protein